MNDKLYPQSLFDEDVKRLHEMDISDELKKMKSNALAHLFLNQNNRTSIEPYSIGESREMILQKE